MSATKRVNYPDSAANKVVENHLKSLHNHDLLAQAIYNCLDRLDRIEVTGDDLGHFLKKELTRRFDKQGKEIKTNAMA